MTRRAFVVLNPVAGTSDRDHVRQVLAEHLDAVRWAYEVYETTGEEDIPQVVQQAPPEHYDIFIAVGGDGTASGVASGLVHAHKPLAVVPTGTGNALARELDIPLALPDAWALATHPQNFRFVDALKLDDRFFFMNMSMGVSAAAMLDTERESKRKFGWLAYVWAGIRQLAGVQPNRFRVRVDGEARDVRASEMVVANAGIIGVQALRLASHIQLDDGRMDVCVIRARSLKDYVQVAWDVMRMRQQRDPHVRFLQATERVIVHASEALPVQADGEFLSYTHTVAVSLVPQALKIVVPA